MLSTSDFDMPSMLLTLLKSRTQLRTPDGSSDLSPSFVRAPLTADSYAADDTRSPEMYLFSIFNVAVYVSVGDESV